MNGKGYYNEYPDRLYIRQEQNIKSRKWSIPRSAANIKNYYKRKNCQQLFWISTKPARKHRKHDKTKQQKLPNDKESPQKKWNSKNP